MKIMKLLIYIIFLLLFITTVTAAQEPLIQSIVRHRDFFIQLNGYDDLLLTDAEVLDNGKSFGVILMSQEGLEQHLVFDVSSMNTIFAKARILNKADREFLFDTSIKMTEVKRLAYAAKMRAEELRRMWRVQEGKPGNIVPISINSTSQLQKKK